MANPTNAIVAANARLSQSGTRTAVNRQSADAPRSARLGESANQSTCGVWIEAAILGIPG